MNPLSVFLSLAAAATLSSASTLRFKRDVGTEEVEAAGATAQVYSTAIDGNEEFGNLPVDLPDFDEARTSQLHLDAIKAAMHSSIAALLKDKTNALKLRSKRDVGTEEVETAGVYSTAIDGNEEFGNLPVNLPDFDEARTTQLHLDAIKGHSSIAALLKDKTNGLKLRSKRDVGTEEVETAGVYSTAIDGNEEFGNLPVNLPDFDEARTTQLHLDAIKGHSSIAALLKDGLEEEEEEEDED